MKKISLISLLFTIVFCLIGCTEPKQFECSLKDGLFQGKSSNSELTISVEFSEITRMEYVKRKANIVKDLSTIDTKFYTPYYVNFILSEGNENYVIEFSQMVAQSRNTTDTYKLSNIKDDAFGRKLDLTSVKIQLIDNDCDKVVDELKIDYKLNGELNQANLKFISDGEDNYDHHTFQYECRLTYDEKIKFDYKVDDLFYAGEMLIYNINKVHGYKVVMYVDNEPYAEIASDGIEVMQFRYVTGYRDVSIEFKLVENK